VPLHIGRTTMVWQTTVSNMDGAKVAIVTQTQIVIPKKPE
jgi:acyl-coenzyme A thioesterase PaaI-like protein